MYKLKEVCAFSVLSFSMIALMPGGAAANHADSRVEFRDCPKCDKRIRIDLAAGKAYVNLSRLEGASREAVAERAARLLDDAVIPPASDPKIRPLMGWSSWNTFGVDISESIILDTARAMATNGLKDAGYVYVNIDDGFFDGHGDDGVLKFHPQRFPNGMKPVVDGIHGMIATSAKIATVEVKTFLSAGVHTIRLFNDSEWMPDIDRMTIR